jgi:hypothetical protein
MPQRVLAVESVQQDTQILSLRLSLYVVLSTHHRGTSSRAALKRSGQPNQPKMLLGHFF